MYSIDDIINGDLQEIDDDNNSIHEDIDEDNNEEVENANNDNEEEVKKDQDDKDENKAAKKPRKKSERPVLNAERLKGPRGLICMEKTFSKLKFRGKGYEQQDLDMIMTTLQHWCHRLYPKFTFDDALEQLERLGTKKPVITLRKKICMDMIDETFGVINQPDEEDEPITQSASAPSPVDQFDLLLEDVRSPVRQHEPPQEFELTEEQLQIMERNRLLAAERRRARLEVQENTEENSLYLQNSVEVHRNIDSENLSPDIPENVVENHENDIEENSVNQEHMEIIEYSATANSSPTTSKSAENHENTETEKALLDSQENMEIDKDTEKENIPPFEVENCTENIESNDKENIPLSNENDVVDIDDLIE